MFISSIGSSYQSVLVSIFFLKDPSLRGTSTTWNHIALRLFSLLQTPPESLYSSEGSGTKRTPKYNGLTFAAITTAAATIMIIFLLFKNL